MCIRDRCVTRGAARAQTHKHTLSSGGTLCGSLSAHTHSVAAAAVAGSPLPLSLSLTLSLSLSRVPTSLRLMTSHAPKLCTPSKPFSCSNKSYNNNDFKGRLTSQYFIALFRSVDGLSFQSWSPVVELGQAPSVSFVTRCYLLSMPASETNQLSFKCSIYILMGDYCCLLYTSRCV